MYYLLDWKTLPSTGPRDNAVIRAFRGNGWILLGALNTTLHFFWVTSLLVCQLYQVSTRLYFSAYIYAHSVSGFLVLHLISQCDLFYDLPADLFLWVHSNALFSLL